MFFRHFCHIRSLRILCGILLGILLCSCEPQKEDQSRKDVATTEQNSITASQQQLSQHQLKQFAQSLNVHYRVLDNRVEPQCEKSIADGQCFLAELILALNIPQPKTNWRIYFSLMSPVREVLSNEFTIQHVNGDLHYLQPTEHFKGWQNGEVHIPFKAAFWQISEFDLPPNFYVTATGLKPEIIESSRASLNPLSKLETLDFIHTFSDYHKQFQRTAGDHSQWADAEYLYQQNQRFDATLKDVSTSIIPQPASLRVDSSAGTIDLSNGIVVKSNDFKIDTNNPALQRIQQLGVAVFSEQNDEPQALPLEIKVSADIANTEGYQLVTAADKITINAKTASGAFYALQSINSLLMPNKLTLPVVEVNDEPRFAFRGLLLDVARNFRDKAFVLRLLDQMAAYKLNRLHLHLGDDEGWRLEIPGLPELTELGAVRCHDLKEEHCLLPQLGSGPDAGNSNNGFYSLDDYRQILLEAKRRHIEIIPSFDMPGHSRAAVKAMELRYQKFLSQGKRELAEEYLLSDLNDQSRYLSVQFYNNNTLNVCKESTYRFVDKVLQEVIQLHRQAGVPLTTYHIGADETAGAWQDSPDCREFLAQHQLSVDKLGDYFVTRVAHYLAEKDIFVAGWSDGLAHIAKESMPEKVQVNIWQPLFWDGHKTAHATANKDWRVVLSLPDVTYFDFPYEADPKERGYYWGSRFTDTRQVFELMPENLPLHAEIWRDRENLPMQLDDTPQAASETTAGYSPMLPGKHFYGLQGQLWSEMVRSDAIAEYMLFPRLMALAERAWHHAVWEPDYRIEGGVYSPQSHFFSEQKKQLRDQDWAVFAQSIARKEFAKLDSAGWLYRLPTLGGKVIDHHLKMNSAFPGLPMEYQLDDAAWQVYPDDEDVEITTGQVIHIRARSPDLQRVGRSLEVNNP